MKRNIGSILLATLALTLIAAVTTGLLAATNALTKDTIATLNAEAATASRQQVLSADNFEEATVTLKDGETAAYHQGVKDGKVIGYVFAVSGSGKSSGLEVMTGVDLEGNITGVAVVSNNETAGYVDKVEKAGLLAALVGKTSTEGVDAISQATKTSNGILKAVDKAMTIYQTVKGEAVE